MSFEARFWVAPGVEVFANRVVPERDGHPPYYWRFAIASFPPFRSDAEAVLFEVQNVEFQLSDWGKGGEVAHYNLISKPPAGWRWIVDKGTLLLDRV